MKRSAAEIRRIENAIINGRVVKIEPMNKPVVARRPPARDSKSGMTKGDRRKIAARIVELSDQVLSTNESDRHIALKIGSGPNSNTVNVSKRYDRVSFFIRSKNLFRKAETEGFTPKPAESPTAPNKDRFRFWELRLSDIEAHEALFREIVKESVSVIMDRRPKKK
jgi:hypothetical protein